MSTSTELEIVDAPAPLESAHLAELQGKIRESHAYASRHAQLAIAHALRAGFALLEAKVSVEHGQFEAFVGSTGLNPRTARRYQALADGMADRIGDDALALLMGDSIDHASLPALSDTLSTATNGATLQQLYLEFGIIRATPATGGARLGNPADAPATAPDASLHAARESDVNRLQRICSDLDTQIRSFAHVRDSVFAASLADTLRQLARAAEQPIRAKA